MVLTEQLVSILQLPVFQLVGVTLTVLVKFVYAHTYPKQALSSSPPHFSVEYCSTHCKYPTPVASRSPPTLYGSLEMLLTAFFLSQRTGSNSRPIEKISAAVLGFLTTAVIVAKIAVLFSSTNCSVNFNLADI